MYLNCNIWVPQGSILGPILFSLNINDLQLVCPYVSIQMYADDTIVYVHAKNKQQAANYLPEALVHVSYWLSKISTSEYKQNCLYVLFTKINSDSSSWCIC